jgi:hypothetical protein
MPSNGRLPAPQGDSLRRIDATLKEFKRCRVEFLVLLSRTPIASLRHEIDANKSGLKAASDGNAVSGGRLTLVETGA